MKKFTLLVIITSPFIIFLLGYAGAYFFLQKSCVTVPSILGKSMRDGALILGQQGLFLAILKEQDDPLLQDGTIVHQLPMPGQQSRFQKPVYVTVIKKSDAKKIPPFYGLTRQEVAELAKKTHLTYTLIELPVTYTDGMCFAQTPAAGSLSRDNKITVYVAQGSNQLRMIPDVRGLVYDEAVPLLTKAGITHELFNASDAGELSLPDHKIIDQRPRAGTFVTADRGLHLQLQVE